MTNPTSNFGWQMPTSTDLVTDLPADFEVFGQAVDTSLADLKGGTTGQVLSKTSNTNMDFTWVTTDDANAIQNTIVDAKGDLIAATASDVPARLAVGTNGQILTADSTAATGLTWTTPTSSAFLGCSLKNSVAIGVANNADQALTFNQENYDTDSMHSTSSNTSRITIPSGASGYYSFRWGATWANDSTGNRRLRLRKNQTTDYQNSALTTKGVGLTIISASTVIYADAGDYFELYAFQDSGGTLDIGISNILNFEANKVG